MNSTSSKNKKIVNVGLVACGLVLVTGCMADAGSGASGQKEPEGEATTDVPIRILPCIPAHGSPDTETVLTGSSACSPLTLASATDSGGDIHQFDVPYTRPFLYACDFQYPNSSLTVRITPQYPSGCGAGGSYGRVETYDLWGYDTTTDQWVDLVPGVNTVPNSSCGTTYDIPVVKPGPANAPHQLGAIQIGAGAVYYTGPTTYSRVPVTVSVIEAASSGNCVH